MAKIIAAFGTITLIVLILTGFALYGFVRLVTPAATPSPQAAVAVAPTPTMPPPMPPPKVVFIAAPPALAAQDLLDPAPIARTPPSDHGKALIERFIGLSSRPLSQSASVAP